MLKTFTEISLSIESAQQSSLPWPERRHHEGDTDGGDRQPQPTTLAMISPARLGDRPWPRPPPLGHQLILVPHPPDGGLGDLVTQLRVEMLHGRGVAVLQSKLPNLGFYLVTVLDITISTGLLRGYWGGVRQTGGVQQLQQDVVKLSFLLHQVLNGHCSVHQPLSSLKLLSSALSVLNLKYAKW